MRSKYVLNKNTNLEIKNKKTKNTIPDTRKKEKTPTYTHFLSFTQTHSKKQHPDLKCNNTNNASLSLSLLSKMSSQQQQQKPRTQIQSKSHRAKQKIFVHINPPSNGGAEAKNSRDHFVRGLKG